MRLFEERRLHLTSWAVGLALKCNPEAGQAMAEAGHEVASHVWRWIDYRGVPEAEERQRIRVTVARNTRRSAARLVRRPLQRQDSSASDRGKIITQLDATTLVLPSWRGSVRKSGALVLAEKGP